MAPVTAYFRNLMRDTLFWRVCMFIWGAPFVAVGVHALSSSTPSGAADWFLVGFLLGLVAFGSFLTYVAVFASDGRVETTMEYMHDGGDFAGIVFVLVVVLLAAPITVLLRAIRGTHDDQL